MDENYKNIFGDVDLNKEKIMLIGGAGFIGHHLALGLRKINANVIVVDNFKLIILFQF